MLFSDAAIEWLETIFEERFGHAFQLSPNADGILMELPGHAGAIQFDRLQPVFHQSRSDFPSEEWDASSEGFDGPISNLIPAPSQEELASPLISHTKNRATVRYDILGLTYWMLTRLEEVGSTDLDEHERFPATASHAFRNGYLDRPIVDEWLIILGQVVSRVWPDITLKTHEFRINVSHDVDRPSLYGFQSWPTIFRMMAGHLLKRHDLKSFFLSPWIKLTTRQQLHSLDPFNTFDWLMDVSEEKGLKSAFYFICGSTNPKYDADYEVEHPAIRNLIRSISERGHEIGIHPSYETFRCPELLKSEFEALLSVAKAEGVSQQVWGGRMHYLRWENPRTMRAWEAVGLTYDSSMGYADSIGFRCGTSYSYPAFDPVDNRKLSLRLRPLVVMESSLLKDGKETAAYLNLLKEKISGIADACKAVDGRFTLLFHNSSLMNSGLRDFYKDILSKSFQ